MPPSNHLKPCDRSGCIYGTTGTCYYSGAFHRVWACYLDIEKDKKAREAIRKPVKVLLDIPYIKTMAKDIGNKICEEREAEVVRTISEMGKSRTIYRCPFCNNTVEVYKWCASGKRCDRCGSFFGFMSSVYRKIVNRG